MAWGRAADRPRVSELERLAQLAERSFLALPEADRLQALEAVQTIASAVAGLKHLPDELVDRLGRIVVKFLLELNMPFARKPSPKALVMQIVAGAPQLLAPHRDRIERLFSAE